MSLEDRESAATAKVVTLIDKQVAHLAKTGGGHQVVTDRVNAAIIWVGTGAVVLRGLATAARSRAEASIERLAELRAFIEDDCLSPPAQPAAQEQHWGEFAAARAEAALQDRAQYLLRPMEDAYLFDRAGALKVWSEFRRLFGAAARSRDLVGLYRSLAVLLKAAIDKATGEEFLSLLKDVLDATRARQKQASEAAAFFTYLDALSYVYARISLLAQCTTLRMSSQGRGLADSQIQELAARQVMQYFDGLRREALAHRGA